MSRRYRARPPLLAGVVLSGVVWLCAPGIKREAHAESLPPPPISATTSRDPRAAAADSPTDAAAPDSPTDGEAAELPPGHPPVGTGPANEMRSPVGTLGPSAAVAPGTIEVHVLDVDDQPVPRATVTLQVHRESVSEGNSDRLLSATTDGRGVTRFEQLSTDSALRYRVLLENGPVKYGPQPFQLGSQQGMSATVRRLELVNDVRHALVAFEAMVYIEPRDSVFQFDVLYRLYNVGASVWVPNTVQVSLPRNSQAFNVPDSGDDVVLKASDGGVRFAGAVTPGQHQLSFTFQVPRRNSPFASFDLGLPPNVMQARVGVAATRGTELTVDGFQEAHPMASQTGQRLLVTMQAFDRAVRLPSELRIELGGLPTLGAGRIVAAVIAGCLALAGLVYALWRHRKAVRNSAEDLQERARGRLLQELAELEAARAAGNIGPKTYEDTRTTLVEALVRLEPASG